MNEKIIDAGFFIDDDDGVRCEGNAFPFFDIKSVFCHDSIGLVASCLYAGVSTPERFNADKVEGLASASVQPVLSQRLNRLKRTDIESFFYWQKASELLK